MERSVTARPPDARRRPACASVWFPMDPAHFNVTIRLARPAKRGVARPLVSCSQSGEPFSETFGARNGEPDCWAGCTSRKVLDAEVESEVAIQKLGMGPSQTGTWVLTPVSTKMTGGRFSAVSRRSGRKRTTGQAQTVVAVAHVPLEVPTGRCGTCSPRGATGRCGTCSPPGATGRCGTCSPRGAKGRCGTCSPRGATGRCGQSSPPGATGRCGTCSPRGATGICGTCSPPGATRSMLQPRVARVEGHEIQKATCSPIRPFEYAPPSTTVVQARMRSESTKATSR